MPSNARAEAAEKKNNNAYGLSLAIGEKVTSGRTVLWSQVSSASIFEEWAAVA